jgi:hypothetical protein
MKTLNEAYEITLLSVCPCVYALLLYVIPENWYSGTRKDG